jgi:hypothetical protein
MNVNQAVPSLMDTDTHSIHHASSEVIDQEHKSSLSTVTLHLVFYRWTSSISRRDSTRTMLFINRRIQLHHVCIVGCFGNPSLFICDRIFRRTIGQQQQLRVTVVHRQVRQQQQQLSLTTARPKIEIYLSIWPNISTVGKEPIEIAWIVKQYRLSGG